MPRLVVKSAFRWAALGTLLGATVVLLIDLALQSAYRQDPLAAAEGPSLLAILVAGFLGLPTSLAIGAGADPLMAAASRVFGPFSINVNIYQMFLGGLVLNWTLLGVAYGTWRGRRQHSAARRIRYGAAPLGWMAAGAATGAAILLLIDLAFWIPYGMEFSEARQRPDVGAFGLLVLLGAPLNLILVPALGQLASAAWMIVGRPTINVYHILAAGLVANWAIGGLLYGRRRVRSAASEAL